MAAKQMGSKIGASDITNRLRKHDPVMFAKINQTTIDRWIDHSSRKA
jgi:hypothetical protein